MIVYNNYEHQLNTFLIKINDQKFSLVLLRALAEPKIDLTKEDITVIDSIFLLFKIRFSVLLNHWCWTGEFCIWSTCNHCYTCNHSA